MISWHRLAKSALVVLLATLAVPVAGAATATPASAAVPSFESSLLSLTNADRARAGLAPLQSSSTLVAVARSWSDHMASTGQLAHNPALARSVAGWSSLGENVAMAYSSSQTESLFMASAGHRANILQRNFNRVGIGVTRAANGAYWVTVDFEQTAGYRPASGSGTTTGRRAAPLHPSNGSSSRAAAAARVSRSTVRRSVPTAGPPAARSALFAVSPAATARTARLWAIDDRSAATGTPTAGQAAAAGVTSALGGSAGPAAAIVLGGLAVTALAGVAALRPARVGLRGRIRFRRGAGG